MNSNISGKTTKQKQLEYQIAILAAELEELKNASVLGEDKDYANGDTIVVNYRFARGLYDYTAALVKSGENKWATTVNQIKGTASDGQATFTQVANYFKHRDVVSAVVLGKDGAFTRLV